MTKPASNRGGTRPGAGRKRGTGHYGEPTAPVRVPISLLPVLRDWLQAGGLGELPTDGGAARQAVPFYASRVAAGSAVAGEDQMNEALDLNSHLVKSPEATFLIRAQGHSMEGAGIYDGDLLVVEQAPEAKDGAVVIASLNGEITVKRLERRGDAIRLLPENPDYQAIEVREDMEFRILGVVAHAIHSL